MIHPRSDLPEVNSFRMLILYVNHRKLRGSNPLNECSLLQMLDVVRDSVLDAKAAFHLLATCVDRASLGPGHRGYIVVILHHAMSQRTDYLMIHTSTALQFLHTHMCPGQCDDLLHVYSERTSQAALCCENPKASTRSANSDSSVTPMRRSWHAASNQRWGEESGVSYHRAEGQM